jgi:hypothetical protein
MLNTYRGWGAAQLRNGERWLEDAADVWMKHHTRFSILTISNEQEKTLKEKGFWVTHIGKGEDNSKMVLTFPCDCGQLEGLWSQRRPGANGDHNYANIGHRSGRSDNEACA